jgi:predicted transcriptional regulator
VTAMLKQRKYEQPVSLFPLAAGFRIVKLGEADAQRDSDELKTLTSLVGASEGMYPTIRRWLREKVVPGLRSSERAAWVAYEGDEPIAAAILKLGQDAKFCHLKIKRDFQDLDLGQLFFTLMALEARHIAKEIHFTLPESLWESKTGFFQSFGFTQAAESARQYRGGDTELFCKAPLRVALHTALGRLPALVRKFNVGGYVLGGDLLVSMKPQYAERILSGAKIIEIRKKFSDRWVGCKAVLYSSSPQQALVGEATVRSVSSGAPEEIWAKFQTGLGCTSSEFSAYVGPAQIVSAIELDDVFPYREPVSLSQISHLLGLEEDLRPPQSYCDLRLDKNQSAWANAAAVAGVLHGRVTCARSISL